MTEQEWEDKLDEVQKHSENWYNKWKQSENKIADIKANCDLAIEGRDIKIKELEKENEQLKQQIEKMKCCGNCAKNGHICVAEEMQGKLCGKNKDKWKLRR